MKIISPETHAKRIENDTDKKEELRQFNIRLDRVIRTDSWINGRRNS